LQISVALFHVATSNKTCLQTAAEHDPVSSFIRHEAQITIK